MEEDRIRAEESKEQGHSSTCGKTITTGEIGHEVFMGIAKELGREGGREINFHMYIPLSISTLPVSSFQLL